jgi:hypothetical protein
MFLKSMAQRMSWAASREATRSEDLAYSLLGLFEINMPMQYGEGRAAFIRLQKEILRNTDDYTLFAWALQSKSTQSVKKQCRGRQNMLSDELASGSGNKSTFGMFAPHPRAFKGCQNIVLTSEFTSGVRLSEKNGAIRATLPIVSPQNSSSIRIGLLPCTTIENPGYMVGILLQPWSSNQRFQRVSLCSGSFTVFVECRTALAATVQKVWIDDTAHVERTLQHQKSQTVPLHRTILINASGTPSEDLRLIKCEPHLETDSTATTLYMPKVDGIGHEVLFLGFESVPSTSTDPCCLFTVCLGMGPLQTLRKEWDKLEDQVSLSVHPIPDYDKDLFENSLCAWGWKSEPSATLHIHGARVDVAVASRFIFNHLITDVTVTVDRFQVNSSS